MKKYSVLACSMVVGLGGFLFESDTAVISSAEKSIQEFWQLSSFEHSLTISIALIGTVVGSLVGSRSADHFGRRNTLYFVAISYLLSSLGTALADDWSVINKIQDKLVRFFLPGQTAISQRSFLRETASA